VRIEARRELPVLRMVTPLSSSRTKEADVWPLKEGAILRGTSQKKEAQKGGSSGFLTLGHDAGGGSEGKRKSEGTFHTAGPGKRKLERHSIKKSPATSIKDSRGMCSSLQKHMARVEAVKKVV